MKKHTVLIPMLAAILVLAGCQNASEPAPQNADTAPPASAAVLSPASPEDERPGATRFIIDIRDRAQEEGLPTDEAVEPFFEDEAFVYSFPSIRSHYILVTYNNGNSEDIITALNAGRAAISDLDQFEIDYITEPKHSHTPAPADNIIEHTPVGYCGNTVTTISCFRVGKDGTEQWETSFWGDRSVALTDLLRHLDYSDDICRCLPEYTVDTEFGSGYGISLQEGYARYNDGQVSLTEQQLAVIRDIIDWLRSPEAPQLMID